MEAQRMLRILIAALTLSISSHSFANKELIAEVDSFAKEINAKLQEQELINNQFPQYKAKDNRPEILIFISLSMSDISIKQWASQADKLGAKLVLRGFVNNSFKQTVRAAHRLFVKDNLGGFTIDPFAFEKYQIKTVPAVVLDADDRFDVVFGNIGLIEALKIIQNEGENGSYAQEYLSRI